MDKRRLREIIDRALTPDPESGYQPRADQSDVEFLLNVEAEITTLDTTVYRLKDENAILRRQLSDVKESEAVFGLPALRNENAGLRTSLDEAKAEIFDLKRALEHEREQARPIRNRMEKALAENSEIRSRLRVIDHTDIPVLRRENEDLRRRLDEANEELARECDCRCRAQEGAEVIAADQAERAPAVRPDISVSVGGSAATGSARVDVSRDVETGEIVYDISATVREPSSADEAKARSPFEIFGDIARMMGQVRS